MSLRDSPPYRNYSLSDACLEYVKDNLRVNSDDCRHLKYLEAHDMICDVVPIGERHMVNWSKIKELVYRL